MDKSCHAKRQQIQLEKRTIGKKPLESTLLTPASQQNISALSIKHDKLQNTFLTPTINTTNPKL